MRRLPALLLAVLLVPAGCGDLDADPSPNATPSPEASTPATSTPVTSPEPPPTRSSTPPSEGLEKIRVVGEVVSAGDCVVVRDDNEITWTLTGDGTGELAVGDRVRATGAPQLGGTGCGGPLVRTTSVTVVD